MKYKNIICSFRALLLLAAFAFIGINAEAQDCSFTINNSGATGGDTEYFLVLDASGNIMQVIPGPGPVVVAGDFGTVTELLHLVYDAADAPTNVPPAMGDDPSGILGCTNDFLNEGILLECICTEEELTTEYTPGGGNTLIYYLVDPTTGDIIESNGDGNFGTDEGNGDYFVYALAYDSGDAPSTLPTTNLREFSEDGCYNPDFLTKPYFVQKVEGADASFTCAAEVSNCAGLVNLSPSIAGGVWTGTGSATVVGDQFDPSTYAVGDVITLTYTVTDAATGCSATSADCSFTITDACCAPSAGSFCD